MTDLGALHHFLGIAVTRTSTLHLSQRQYILDVLSCAGMRDYNPASTPVDTKSPVSDPFHYRNLVGALEYITLTRPEISYVVQQLCPYA
jgi:histone deacetylase 1/2